MEIEIKDITIIGGGPTGIFGLFYAALSVIGFVVGDGLIFNLISSSKIDSWGHGFLGLVLFLTGFASLQCPCINRNCAPTTTSAGA